MTAAFVATRRWRYEGYEGGIEDGLILVDGQRIGGTYHCSYNPAEQAGWGHYDGPATGESWASYGPRGYSFGHTTREAAEMAQVREYATNPDLYDRLNAQARAEEEAEAARSAAEEDQRNAERELADRLQRLGDDQLGPTVWTLPAYHVLYAPMGEVEAVSAWFTANGLRYVDATREVRVEQRASRTVIVYESAAKSPARGGATETTVVTLTTEPPTISTPARPELHALLDRHWPARFPLIDFGASMACGWCTREAGATVTFDMVTWPCATVAAAIEGTC